MHGGTCVSFPFQGKIWLSAPTPFWLSLLHLLEIRLMGQASSAGRSYKAAETAGKAAAAVTQDFGAVATDVKRGEQR